jgi:lactoylglutathione lyase
MIEARKARAVGFNHVALEVGDIEEALAFYGRLFDFELRGKSATSAFIDLGDQFLALQKGRTQPADEGRHFGLVVDDKDESVKHWPTGGLNLYPARFSTFSIRGAIASRLSATTTSNSPRRRTCCAAWG